jgi:hypothetical protein
MNDLIWPALDDIGYEFRRESLLEMRAGSGPARPVLALVPPARCRVCRSRLDHCWCPAAVLPLAA